MDGRPLAQRDCGSVDLGKGPLKGDALTNLATELGDGWKLVGQEGLEKEYEFDDFQGALEFTNKVGTIAEDQDHHPEIELGWGRVYLRLSTHEVGGLSEKDFILAAKADRAHSGG